MVEILNVRRLTLHDSDEKSMVIDELPWVVIHMPRSLDVTRKEDTVDGNYREVHDDALHRLTLDQLRDELVRVRNHLRWHRDLSDNDRCWHADRELYGRTLPEDVEPGRMTLPRNILLGNCEVYIDGQQCQGRGCTGEHLRPPGHRDVRCENCGNGVPFADHQSTARCIQCGQTITRTGAVMRIG